MNRNESRYFNTAVKMDKAFLELLEKKDFPYITVKEICAKAEVNRSTFYLHYETLNDLLSESVEYLNQQFLDYMGKSSVPEPERRYIMAFYIRGLMAIIEEWMRGDCSDSIDYVIAEHHRFRWLYAGGCRGCTGHDDVGKMGSGTDYHP